MRAKFRVETVSDAELDLRAIHEYIARDKPIAASRWLQKARSAVRSLRYFPYAHEIVPEAEEIGIELRHMIFGNYRIIFRIEEKLVRVMRVIQAARRLTRDMFEVEHG